MFAGCLAQWRFWILVSGLGQGGVLKHPMLDGWLQGVLAKTYSPGKTLTNLYYRFSLAKIREDLFSKSRVTVWSISSHEKFPQITKIKNLHLGQNLTAARVKAVYVTLQFWMAPLIGRFWIFWAPTFFLASLCMIRSPLSNGAFESGIGE